MAVALTLYEASLCACGQPISRAHNPDMEGYYSKVERECQACAVVELARDEGRPRPGRKLAVRDDSFEEGFEPDPRFLAATRALAGESAAPTSPD